MDDQNQGDELYPIAVLIDELKHDDVLLRLNAIRRLSTIALALGPERTRDELIPFLDESVEDEDEVLTALSEELGNFVEYVGGPDYGHVLLSPLENLATIEEPLVRDKVCAIPYPAYQPSPIIYTDFRQAVESLNKICDQLSQQQVEQYFIPLTVRLSKADWFTSKISAAALYTTPYHHVTPQSQEGLRQQFAQLVHDDTPMVRRQAATNLAKFVKEMPAAIVIEEMIPLFQHLAADDQDSVRLLTVDVLIAVAEAVPKEQQSSHGVLLTALRSLFEDKSWRVRYMVADRFEKIAKAVDEEVISRDLVPAFVKLLKDTEAEVRSAVAGQIPGFCQLVDRQTLLTDIMPAIEELVSDSSQHVRAAFGNQISGLAPILGKQETTEHLLPMFLQMLKDDFPDVRLNIISKLELVNNVIGIDLLSQSLLPAIVQLAEDKQWRVRLAIIQHVPLLASQLGVKFFDEKLSSLCMSWLGDTVFSIREASTQNLKKLTEVFGVQWASTAIVPKVAAMAEHPNYLYRMTTCFAVSTLAPALSFPILAKDVLPILHQLVEDPIPNIRFNVAKSYAVLIDNFKHLPDDNTTLARMEKEGTASSAGGMAKGEEVIREEILPPLEKLMRDEDVDVRFFATMAGKGFGDAVGMGGNAMET
ncbi:Polyamine N-acetyltransferase 1 [Meristemomyces frigidus]|uniref:Polyamine N-acetyltransferase 1 n=1 Tax=Meristemomyces frigidus TaxID=1508187 RepID=A0AAN7TFB4_9PEZI|nr:Polyamine N-acetyltransferase 1 [Meristemomyces frigidus]